MANFFELLGFDSNDMADAMPEKIVQVGTGQPAVGANVAKKGCWRGCRLSEGDSSVGQGLATPASSQQQAL